jgi:hypothetical protein
MYRRTVLLMPGVLWAAASCAPSVNTQQTTTLNGVVETIDPVARELLLRGNSGAQSGALVTMVVGSGVQRLNDIHSGDRVTVTYYQALAAQMVNVLSGSPPPPVDSGSLTRNDTAERPGGQVTRVRRGRVTITAVDHANNTVSFVGPGNIVRTVSPKNADVQALIQRLNVGDQVDITYEEALAVSVDPMK